MKINDSIEYLKKNEGLALRLNPYGYHLAFSGGKDSQVIYDIVKKSGVKYKAFYNVTTVDPPNLVRFIHQNYKDVEFVKPERTMFDLIRKNKYLPLRQIRYCCKDLKERTVKNNAVVVTGIRKAESHRRAKRQIIEHTCQKGKDVIYLNPIMEWTDSDVWNYVRKEIGYYCELYDNGFKRLGCVLCPYASPKVHYKEIQMFPRIIKQYDKAIQDIMSEGSYPDFDNSNDVLMAWISGKSFKNYKANLKQLKIFAER